MGNLLLSLITFLSAFLLFQIELVIAKIFLPNYGGSYLVWGACMVFFQAVLLVGYWFAHAVTRRISFEKYRSIHLALLAAPLLFFPGRNLAVEFGPSSLPLVVDIFLRLSLNIGLVFFALSTISIVTQVWLSESKLSTRVNPYRLYAISNLGSFAALFTYPFLVELLLDLDQQLLIWRTAYGALLLLNLLAFVLVPVVSKKISTESSVGSRLPVSTWLRWMLLGAGGSMMFMSVNNLITYELPPVPLFWIFPLSVYLISFVLNFKQIPWCPAWITQRIHMVIGVALGYFFFTQKYVMPPIIALVCILSLLFCLCMYCQNQLIRSKPSRKEDLSAFYFIISLGSFLGGVCTAWIAPLVSTSMVEYLWALIVISAAVTYASDEPRLSPYSVRIILYMNVFLTLWASHFIAYNFLGIVLLFFVVGLGFSELSKSRHALTMVLISLLVSMPATQYLWDRRATDKNWSVRNYYGIHSVIDYPTVRCLYHGATWHGAQSLVPGTEQTPLTYYGPGSGMRELLISESFQFSNLAFIGLGAGTFAAYGKEHQTYDVFELDPDVYKIATERFSFLSQCKAKLNVFLGDARISIEKLKDRSYDFIMLDAFGSETIPIHLITQEAIQLYRERLTSDGILLIHISNRYVHLDPLIAKTVVSLGAKICRKSSNHSQSAFSGSDWVVVTWSDQIFNDLTLNKGWQKIPLAEYAAMRPWTDRYSSVLPIIKVQYLFDSIKYFCPFYW